MFLRQTLAPGAEVKPAALRLSATISQYFMDGMIPESANPVKQPHTMIEIRPFKDGWQCYEGPGVQPYWTGATAKEDAIGYATACAKFGRGGEIRVLDHDGKVEGSAHDRSAPAIALTRAQAMSHGWSGFCRVEIAFFVIW